MGKGNRNRKLRPDLHDDNVRLSRERGLAPDHEGEVSEVQATPEDVEAEIQASLAEFRDRGCTCTPDVVARQEGDELDGMPVLHTYFLHDEWCPFLRLVEEGSR